MPDLKICRCGKIIKKSDKYCKNCMEKELQKKIRQNKTYDKYKRNRDSKAFYSSAAWQRIAALVKSRQSGVCILCYHNHTMTAGTIVHHIQPVREAWHKRLDPKNCVLLCAACHANVHAEYDRDKQSKDSMQRLLTSLATGGGF